MGAKPSTALERMEDLIDLIRTLERAEDGTVGLDRAIVAALGDSPSLPDKAYSSSIDVALTLMPETGYWEIICISNDGVTQFACELHPANNRPPVIGLGKTGALAVTSAVLKAKRELSSALS